MKFINIDIIIMIIPGIFSGLLIVDKHWSYHDGLRVITGPGHRLLVMEHSLG